MTKNRRKNSEPPKTSTTGGGGGNTTLRQPSVNHLDGLLQQFASLGLYFNFSKVLAYLELYIEEYITGTTPTQLSREAAASNIISSLLLLCFLFTAVDQSRTTLRLLSFAFAFQITRLTPGQPDALGVAAIKTVDHLQTFLQALYQIADPQSASLYCQHIIATIQHHLPTPTSSIADMIDSGVFLLRHNAEQFGAYIWHSLTGLLGTTPASTTVYASVCAGNPPPRECGM